MRIAAIILGAIALLTIQVEVFFFWISSAFICFDACPPVSSIGPQLLHTAALSLGSGLLLSLVAWILSLIVLRAEGRSTAFLVTLLTPIVVIIAAALTLYIAGGSFTPVAATGGESPAPADPQVSSDWIRATSYAVFPLIIWPFVSFITALWRLVRPRG